MAKRSILSGADALLAEPYLLRELGQFSSLGLVTNPTGITKDARPVYEALRDLCPLTALFSPEHGVRGDRQAGAEVAEYRDEATGLPVYSTYGPGRTRAEEAMASISFDAMKTLRYIHPNSRNMLFDFPVEYVTADKEACLKAAKDYDFIALKVSGEKLLEALNDGEGKKEIRRAGAQQRRL